jgi:hypothetical protein
MQQVLLTTLCACGGMAIGQADEWQQGPICQAIWVPGAAAHPHQAARRNSAGVVHISSRLSAWRELHKQRHPRAPQSRPCRITQMHLLP